MAFTHTLRNLFLITALLFSLEYAVGAHNPNGHASSVALFGIPRGGMQLFVKTLTGKTVTIDVRF